MKISIIVSILKRVKSEIPKDKIEKQNREKIRMTNEEKVN